MTEPYIPATGNNGKHIIDPQTGLIMYTGSYQTPDMWVDQKAHKRAEAASVFIEALISSKPVTTEMMAQLVKDIPGARQMAARCFGLTERQLQQTIEDGSISIKDFVEQFRTAIIEELHEDDVSPALTHLYVALYSQIA